MWLMLLIGCRTKRWMNTSGIQQGGEHATQGVDEFVPAFAPFQGRTRLAHAPRKRHVHSQSELIGLGCRSIFSQEATRPTHISLIRFR